MDIKFKEVFAFREGLRQGAMDFALDVNDINRSLVKTSYYKKYERDSFGKGYSLGNCEKYRKVWGEGGKSLTLFAEREGDIELVGWFHCITLDGVYIEED